MKCHNFHGTILLACTLTSLVGSVLSNVGSAQTEEKPTRKFDTTTKESSGAAGKATSPEKGSVWICPMHPKIRFHQPERCPVCAMQLVVFNPDHLSRQLTGSMSLPDMLSVALEHNPDVRVAEAKLRSAEAELDQTRLQVVQKIIAYREKWQTQQASVRAAEQELVEAKRTEKFAKQGLVSAKNVKPVSLADEKLALQRTKLADIEAELPFLLGAKVAQANRDSANSRKLIQDQMLPKAQQILELRTQEYAVGDAQIRDVIEAHLQILFLELRLATSPPEKLVVLQSRQKLLKQLLAVVQEKYRAGKTPQADVLTIDLEILKVDLKRRELLGD